MYILLTGATGFIGRPLVTKLLGSGHHLVLWVRNKAKAQDVFRHEDLSRVTIIEQLTASDIPIDAVINLAGEGIMDRPWSAKRKRILAASRVDLTRELVQWIAQQASKPALLISGSAIGIYGNYPEDKPLDEQAAFRDCYPSRLCQQWEFEAGKAQALGVSVCFLRTGVVLHPEGGALKKMWMPFKLGLGGRVGSGKQWLSWIHLGDMLRLIEFVLEKQISGPVNATAPEPVSYSGFTRTLASTLGRPHLFPVPELAIKLLFGEAAQLLIEGQKVIPKKLMDKQFSFTYQNIQQALASFVDTK